MLSHVFSNQHLNTFWAMYRVAKNIVQVFYTTLPWPHNSMRKDFCFACGFSKGPSNNITVGTTGISFDFILDFITYYKLENEWYLQGAGRAIFDDSTLDWLLCWRIDCSWFDLQTVQTTSHCDSDQCEASILATFCTMAENRESKLELVTKNITPYPDFPNKGILFR